MSSTEGSRTLGRVLRGAFDKVESDAEAREQMLAAILAIRSGPRVRWSIDQVIDDYLGDVAADAVRRGAPSDAARSGHFQLDREQFMANLQFRAFDLVGGIRVIAPVELIGDQVRLDEDDDGRVLAVEGRVEDERFRARL